MMFKPKEKEDFYKKKKTRIITHNLLNELLLLA
jgi:hypothetical protein